MHGARTLDSAVLLANCQVHPLVFQILFRVPSLSLPPVPFREQASCQGFGPRATFPGASTHLEASQVLDTFRPQVLSTSRRLSPRSGSTGLFRPAAASRAFARSGACLLHAATASSSEASSPLPLLTGRSPARVWRPQPVTSASRPSSAWSSRSRESVVSLPSGRSPPRVCAPPGLLFPPWSRFTREPPLMKLPDQTRARAFALALA